MIPIAQAIVYVSTMVIKLLNTRFAIHTVESAIRLDHFTVKAEILKVNIFLISYI